MSERGSSQLYESMAMLVSYLQSMSDMNITGLCHSVQERRKCLQNGSEQKKSRFVIHVRESIIRRFILILKWMEKDAYRIFYKTIEKTKKWRLKNLSESKCSRNLDILIQNRRGHNSEYVAWFRKRPDLIEKYCTHGTGWNRERTDLYWMSI